MRVILKCGKGKCWNQEAIRAHVAAVNAAEAAHKEQHGNNAVIEGTIACDGLRMYSFYETQYCTARAIPSLGPRPEGMPSIGPRGRPRRPDVLEPGGDSTVIADFIDNNPVGPQPFSW